MKFINRLGLAILNIGLFFLLYIEFYIESDAYSYVKVLATILVVLGWGLILKD